MGVIHDIINKTVETVTTTVEGAGKVIETTVQNAGKEAEIGVQNIGKEAEKAINDVGDNLEKAVQDIGKTGSKATNDSIVQLGRSYDDIVVLAEASYHFVENQVEGINQSVTDAANRISEGKIIDAIWHYTLDPVKILENSAAEAVMESSLLNNLAAAGSAVYGGPGGAAAYAAWYAYSATGNLEVALRAGAIAWATSAAGSVVKGIDGNSFDRVAQRTFATSVIGGAAVAASGGTDEQVLAAFGRGAIVGSAREVYNSVTHGALDGKAPIKAPILKAKLEGEVLVKSGYKTLDNGQLDITSMPRDISHVGIATGNADPGYFSMDETSGLMQDLAKLPYMNGMALFHDQWMALTNTEGILVQVTILPAIALTAAASDPALSDPSTKVVIENEKT
jgi:hypothetical protein